MSTVSSGRTRMVPGVTIVAVLAGCATGAPAGGRDPSTISIITGGGNIWEVRREAEVRVNQRVTVTQDAAWAALPGVFEELGIDADVYEPAVRRMGVNQHRFSGRVLNRSASDFFDCGLDPGLNRPLADQMPISAQVVTQVLAAADGAELHTDVKATARRSGGNAGIATCRSTGLLEVLIGEMVQTTAARPGV